MSKITTINEPWDGHDYPEVEAFVKESLVDYKKKVEYLLYDKFPERRPLTFEAAEDGVKLYFNCYNENEQTRTIEVSTDGGETWKSFTSESYNEDSNTPIASLNAGQTALVRGDNEAMGYYSEDDNTPHSGGSFRIVGRCYVYGNVMSLLDSEHFYEKTSVSEYAFYSLFFDEYDETWSNPTLLSHPERRLLLLATTLAEYCYCSMFQCCVSLVTAPSLPATTLAPHCYRVMFCDCHSLVDPPALPATSLAPSCYLSMFEECSSIVSAPSLPATMLADSCYNNLFRDCTSLVNPPVLSATNLASSCYRGMFQGCTSLINAPELATVTMSYYCYGGMFYGCTSLVDAPALPATTMAEGCYFSMFNGCTSLVNAPALPATTLANYCYGSMFHGCTSLANSPALPATTLAKNCYNDMFYLCKLLTTAPELPATTLERSCYESMFKECINLTFVKAMFTTAPSTAYTKNWLYHVLATGTFVKNAAATWDVSGANGIPTGWTVETADA